MYSCILNRDTQIHWHILIILIFHYIPEIGISVQGVDARHAWTYALCLAKFTRTPIKVTVTWRNKEKSAFPGESGIIEWQP